MRTQITFRGKTYQPRRIRNISAVVDTSLNCRVLDVDEMQVEVSTGPRSLALLTSEGRPLLTSDGKRLYTSESTDFGAWSASDAVQLLRGGSLYATWYPQQLTQTGDNAFALATLSVLGRLLRLEHRGGVYNNVQAGPLIREICGYRNGSPTAVTVAIQPNFETILVSGYLPYLSPTGENGAAQGSAKDNLLQVLFALGATVRDDASGVLHIENLSTSPQSTIGRSRIYREGAQVVTELPITSVTVLEHQWITGDAEDEEILFEGAASGEQVVVFGGPYSGLTATEGLTIVASDANFAIVSGTGTLTGIPYTHTTREVTRAVTAATDPNPERVEGATMIATPQFSAAATERLAEYYTHRTRIECDAKIEFEDAGDVVNIYDPFSHVLRSACIESINGLVPSNVMKGRISALVGFTPWQTTPFEDVRVVLTGSGTFTVPAGVTELTVVLFGGAQGGAAGYKGGDGATQSISFSTEIGSRYTGYAPGKGGDGGLGGEGGGAGRMLRVDLSVTPGQTIAFACGAGGAGGVYVVGGEAGSLGADTTFGAYSTAAGAPNAYTDPVTGDVYGADGATGIAGGKGAGFSERPDQSNLFAFEPAESVTVDGVTYAAGSCAESGGKLVFGSSSAAAKGGEPNVVAAASVSLGSGAAAGAAGTNGSLAATGYGTSGGGTSSVSGYANAQAGKNGASASLTPAQAQRAAGGRGGYGGGGGSGIGWAVAATVGSVSLSLQTNTPGVGGDGSDGGQGGDGLIILYYRQPVA